MAPAGEAGVKRRLKPSEHFVAGTLAGLVSTVALFPLDTIKVRYQVDERTSLKAPQRLWGAVRGIVTKEGWQGLYQGLSAGMAGAGLSWGGYFYFYEHAKRRWVESNGAAGPGGSAPAPAGALQHMCAACEAGTIMVALTNPIWLIKTRMQLQLRSAEPAPMAAPAVAAAAPISSGTGVAAAVQGRPIATTAAAASTAATATVLTGARPYRGFVDALLTIVREEGVLALYKGSIPALLLVSHGAVQFVVYEKLKQLAPPPPSSSSSSSPAAGSPYYLAMGAVAKIIASVSTYPFQVVKTRLQQRHGRSPEVAGEGASAAQATTAKLQAPVRWSAGMVAVGTRAQYRGVVDCVTRTWRSEGVYGFYKGCLPNALRVAPGAAITFYTYELVADALRVRAR